MNGKGKAAPSVDVFQSMIKHTLVLRFVFYLVQKVCRQLTAPTSADARERSLAKAE